MCFITFKLAMGYASKINELSKRFSKTQAKRQLTKEQRAIVKSFKPMVIRVGGTFTITCNTFPKTVEYIFGHLVDLLITF